MQIGIHSALSVKPNCPLSCLLIAKACLITSKKEGSVPEDKWVAVKTAELRGAVSAGPGRNMDKAECKWVPSKWQLAGCLTKNGLAGSFRKVIAPSTTKLHEISLREAKRKSANEAQAKKINFVTHDCCYSCWHVDWIEG